MGGNESKTEQLSEFIAKQTIDVSTSSKFNAMSVIKQDATITARGGAKINGVDISQVATVNITAIKSESSNMQFMADLKETIDNKLKSNKDTLSIGDVDDTTIKTIVDKSVSMNYNTEKLEALQSEIDQKAKILATDEGSTIDDAKIAQKADSFIKLVSTVSNDMATQIMSNTSMSTSSDITKTNALSTVAGVIGKTVTDVVGELTGLFEASSSTKIVVVIIFILLAITGIVTAYIMYGKKKMEPPSLNDAKNIFSGTSSSSNTIASRQQKNADSRFAISEDSAPGKDYLDRQVLKHIAGSNKNVKMVTQKDRREKKLNK